jgi:hypothetical protein
MKLPISWMSFWVGFLPLFFSSFLYFRGSLEGSLRIPNPGPVLEITPAEEFIKTLCTFLSDSGEWCIVPCGSRLAQG